MAETEEYDDEKFNELLQFLQENDFEQIWAQLNDPDFQIEAQDGSLAYDDEENFFSDGFNAIKSGASAAIHGTQQLANQAMDTIGQGLDFLGDEMAKLPQKAKDAAM